MTAAAALWILVTVIALVQVYRCGEIDGCKGKEVIAIGSQMTPVGEEPVQTSDNGVFAFGFLPVRSTGEYQLSLWFAQIPGNLSVVWSPNSVSAVGKNATLVLDTTGNLVLTSDGNKTVWQTSTTNSRAEKLILMDSGNLALCNSTSGIVWESFAHPSNTLLPGQRLTRDADLAATNRFGACYTFRMAAGRKSFRPELTYFAPWNHTNHTYWTGPIVDLGREEVSVELTESGSFVMVKGAPPDIVAYIFRNNRSRMTGNTTKTMLNSANNTNTALNSKTPLRMIKLGNGGNLRLYWHDEGQKKWVTKWVARSNPCMIPGECGTGICSLSPGWTGTVCTCPPGHSQTQGGKCGLAPALNRCSTTMARLGETNYFVGSSWIDRRWNLTTESECSGACAADCNCAASVFTFSRGEALCSTLSRLELGGFRDPESTVYVKIHDDGVIVGNGRTKEKKSEESEENIPWLFIAHSAIAVCFLLPLCIPIHWLVRSLRRRAKETKQGGYEDGRIIVPGLPKRFSFAQLETATLGFSNLLGVGGFGHVYKGSLSDGTQVAVKRLDAPAPHRQEEFEAEVVTIGAMNHANLVRLHGFCSEGENRLLVYEFMENESLDKRLFPRVASRDKLLEWKTRFAIAVSTARGIAYCHEQCRDCIIHCDIKPGNILLDKSFNAKVSDFGLAKLVAGEDSDGAAKVRGTSGYLAPEWLTNQPITVKVDVYSYGMVLLELIRGRKMSSFDEDSFYPRLAYEQMMNGRQEAAADERLKGDVDAEELARCFGVAFWCLQEDMNLRPTMGEVVQMLEGTVPIKTPPPPKSFADLMDDSAEFSVIVSKSQECSSKFSC